MKRFSFVKVDPQRLFDSVSNDNRILVVDYAERVSPVQVAAAGFNLARVVGGPAALKLAKEVDGFDTIVVIGAPADTPVGSLIGLQRGNVRVLVEVDRGRP